jgi:hypothetical protein
MTKFEDVKQAVEQLPPEEFEKFRAWFENLEEQLFDERIERDEKAGKLDKLAERARENYRAGRFRDL